MNAMSLPGHRIVFLFIVLLAFYSVDKVLSQPSDKSLPRPDNESFWRRVHVGGNLGFQFGTVTGIVVSPDVSIRMIDRLYGGVGFTYQYYRYKNYYYNQSNGKYFDFTSNVLGGRVFFQYYLSSLFDNFLGNIFAHTEYEYLNYSRPYKFDDNGNILDPWGNKLLKGKESIDVNSLFVGGGYRQPIGGKVYMSLLVLYNLNETFYSPYSNPIIRIGVGVGL
ncbi:MAG: hypothetical protein FJY10_12440 [Bacteroidetes bacterium]|nr:hypothetical protein [Bacteroidota bacterium]